MAALFVANRLPQLKLLNFQWCAGAAAAVSFERFVSKCYVTGSQALTERPDWLGRILGGLCFSKYQEIDGVRQWV